VPSTKRPKRICLIVVLISHRLSEKGLPSWLDQGGKTL
jgi:hypothetical protein